MSQIKSRIKRDELPVIDRRVLVVKAQRRLAAIRENFFAYRRYMDPSLLEGWFVQDLSLQLQKFNKDFEAGKRPKLAIAAPPQHGKSRAAEDFIAWSAGLNPNLKIIYASYSDELGIMRNMMLQRTLKHPNYQLLFPATRAGVLGYQENTGVIEFSGHRGSFRNVTVNGQINGMELNLGIIDDPVKGQAEAMSPTIRERTWNWFTHDFMGRFAKDGALLIIMTRWNVDDLLGRLCDLVPDVRVLSYPAIAEKPDDYRDVGEVLFPEFKPLDMLLERKKLLTASGWEALYQQHPIVVGGGMLPIEKLQVLPFCDRGQILKSVRYVDKAASKGGDGAFTAMVLMHAMKDKTYVIQHVVRGRWGVLEREQNIKAWAERDRASLKGPYQVIIEQEPGSGGQESIEATLRNLRGFAAFPDRVTGRKETRAEPFAAQVASRQRLFSGW